MKNFLDFLTAIVLLAMVNYVTVALGVVLVILVLMSAITYPRRTLQLFAAVGLLALVFKQPAVCAITPGAVGGAGVIAHQLRRRCTSTPLLQWDNREPA
jgi:hypothetical protein